MPNYLPDDYKGVDKRIQNFREDHPEGQVETKIQGMFDGAIGFSALVKAGDASATGHGFGSEEAVGDTVEEKWREYAETVAVGRALKHLGYEATGGSTQSNTKQSKSKSKPKGKQDDKETPEADMDTIQDEIEEKKAEWGNFDDPATDKQAEAFSSFWEENVGTGREDKLDFLEVVTGRDLDSSKDLYKGEASPLLEQCYNNTEEFVELCQNYEIPF
mgnify:CR=1 FL=1